jgi:hypothetical protein
MQKVAKLFLHCTVLHIKENIAGPSAEVVPVHSSWMSLSKRADSFKLNKKGVI